MQLLRLHQQRKLHRARSETEQQKASLRGELRLLSFFFMIFFEYFFDLFVQWAIAVPVGRR